MPNLDESHLQRVFAGQYYSTHHNLQNLSGINSVWWRDQGWIYNRNQSLTRQTWVYKDYHYPYGDVLLPELEVKFFRLSTDRNKALLNSLRKLPRTYVLKDVRVRDVCKREKYYDYKHWKWRTRPVDLIVKRLVPVKRSLSALLKRQKGRVSNDLVFISTSFPVRAEVTNVTFLWNTSLSPEYPEGSYLQRRILFEGSLLAADVRSISTDHYAHWEYPLINWDTGSLGSETEQSPLGWPGTYSQADASLVLAYFPEIDDLDQKCVSKLYSRIKAAKLDLATDLAELSQTAGLISSMAIQIGKAFLLLKKGNVFEALALLVPKNRGEVSNVFLAFRYGVQPLLSDVEGAAQMLAERILNLLPQSVKTKKRTSLVTTEVLGNFTFTRTTVIDVKYKVFYDIDGTETLSNLSRLGFTSPTNVAWELIPFSFVIDWFLPIGNYLGSLSALHGYKLREIVKTVSVRQTVFCDFLISSAPQMDRWVPEKDIISSWSVERLEVRRETIPSLPNMPLPRFRNPFTFGRALNALALLSQMFK